MTSRRHYENRGKAATGGDKGRNQGLPQGDRGGDGDTDHPSGQAEIWGGKFFFGTFVSPPPRRGLLRKGGARAISPEAPVIETVVGHARLVNRDCFGWLRSQPTCSIEGVVTDPPYGLVEYSDVELGKMKMGRGGVWRIPPSLDGVRRQPVPRFTTLTRSDLTRLDEFFTEWARALLPVLVPGAHVIMASNPLLSHVASGALSRAGLERRGEIVRLVTTLRGGDRPKGAHAEFSDVSVMARSMWEPWLLYRKPIEGRVQDNLRIWHTGGLRRQPDGKPFGDVIRSHPTRPEERRLAPHPSLKPQAYLRQVVRAVLPLGIGTVLDPFAGSGSTLAAAEALGYRSVGIESDPDYFAMAVRAVPVLARLGLAHSGDRNPASFPVGASA